MKKGAFVTAPRPFTEFTNLKLPTQTFSMLLFTHSLRVATLLVFDLLFEVNYNAADFTTVFACNQWEEN